MGVNKAILVGNLGRDPEIRRTGEQMAVCNFSIATGERRKDASGNWSDHTEWHRVVCFGKTAEFVGNYCKKGRSVYVEGRIQTRKWQDKDGKDRYTTEIVAQTVQALGGRDSASANGTQHVEMESYGGGDDSVMGSLRTADAVANAAPNEVPFDDDDIPF